MPKHLTNSGVTARATPAVNEQEIGSIILSLRNHLESRPDDALALNRLANLLLKAGDPGGASELLRRAIAVDPAQPAVWFNLGAAEGRLGAVKVAIDAFDQALRIDPHFVQAMFQKAILLERSGDQRSAVVIYRDFLKSAPDEVLQSERFAGPIGHARSIVAADDDQLALRLALVDEAAPNHRMRRVSALLTGRNRSFHAEPTFLTIPQLPAIEFFDRRLCPWLDELEASTAAIAAEAVTVLAEDARRGTFTPYVANPPGTALEQWAELDHNPAWSAFHLWKHGTRIEGNVQRCPEASRLVAKLPLLKLAGRAPNVFFSLLRSGAKIPPHTGVTNARATVHLPLCVPPGCGFRVGADIRSWEEGNAWMFDDTIEHEAWNLSSEPRLVLILDAWNPLLNQAEQTHIASALAAYDAHQGTGQQAGDWSG